jgi:hypothetical protein
MLSTRPAPCAGILDNFMRWLWGHRGTIAVAGLVSFAGPTTFFAGAVSVMKIPDPPTVTALALSFALYGTLLWLFLLVSGYAFWRLDRGGRAARAALALLLAAAAVAAADTATADRRQRINVEQGVVASRQTMQLYSATFSLAMALLFFAHLQRGRAHEDAAARLAVAQAAQRELRRRAAEARLKAWQARIDPQFLFDMLDEVRRCYGCDAERAEQALDALVAFLRAALPRLRRASSSVSRESELVRAYARLRAMVGATDVRLTLGIGPDAADARFPPGVLVPLLVDALRHGSGPCELTASRGGEGCRIAMKLPAHPSQATVDRVRILLDDLYASSAALRCESRADGSVDVVISVPHEPA